MAIGTNTTLVENAPQTFADLEDPQYEGQVALNGDPREAGAAFAAVMAASLANGGSFDDIMPGIQFFADLKAERQPVRYPGDRGVRPRPVRRRSSSTGRTTSPGCRRQIEEAGFEVEVVVPSDGVYGSYYSQGVVADGPHPNAAKLWIEHILSDEGALGLPRGWGHPGALRGDGRVRRDHRRRCSPTCRRPS